MTRLEIIASLNLMIVLSIDTMLCGALQFHIEWLFQENMCTTDEVFPRMTLICDSYVLRRAVI